VGSTRKLVAAVAVAGCIVGLAVGSSSSAGAASGPIFPVMNTSETPPDGVWFRNSPSTGDTDRATGHGVYAGDRVQLQCYAWGEAVGAYANRLWYYVNNVTRPTVSSNGQPNVGYLNAHYVNDGQPANVVDAGVGQCGAAPPPPPAPTPAVSLAQGPAAPVGYRYAISLAGFAANTAVSISCRDSVNPGGFFTFSLTTNGAGGASTQSYCYSGDGPDHWVVAGGVESNRVSWGGSSGGGGGGGAPAPPGGSGSGTIPAPPAGTKPAPTEACEAVSGVQSPAKNISSWLFGRFEGGYSSPVVIPWSYFSGNPQFVRKAKSIAVGDRVVGWRAVFPSDMYFALGHFTIAHTSANCYSIYDLYDFDNVELPLWLQQKLHSAIPFDVRSAGKL
jgi:hypothetical protein